MVESGAILAFDGSLNLGPFAIAELVGQVEENGIGLFTEKLGLLCCVNKVDLIDRILVLVKFCLNH
jgi:hypothetical protein